MYVPTFNQIMTSADFDITEIDHLLGKIVTIGYRDEDGPVEFDVEIWEDPDYTYEENEEGEEIPVARIEPFAFGCRKGGEMQSADYDEVELLFNKLPKIKSEEDLKEFIQGWLDRLICENEDRPGFYYEIQNPEYDEEE